MEGNTMIGARCIGGLAGVTWLLATAAPVQAVEQTRFPVQQIDDGHPDAATAKALKRFNQDRFAMFIHWGIYSAAGGVFQGKRYYGLSEWLMHNAKASPA